MKRIGNLYGKIISIENLTLADAKARKGKGNSYGVKLHDRNREANIIALHNALKNKTYRTSKYHTFIITDPKERIIFRLPYYPDRIVHHAVMNVMEPIWVSLFTRDTYSCIKGRGITGCYKAVKKALRDKEGTKYCLKLDIRKFYPSVDHAILKDIIRRKIKDNDLLDLLDEIIDSAEGLPIGNYLSQYLSNLYLTYLDHYIKEVLHVKYYFRYADDMVFLAHKKEPLWAVLAVIKEYLTTRLNLELKANWQVFPVEARGLDYVGFVFRHTHIKLRKCIKTNFCKRLAKLNRKNLTAKQYIMQLAGWIGWLKQSDSRHFLTKTINAQNYESILRCIAKPA